jgi:hypothetical protein
MDIYFGGTEGNSIIVYRSRMQPQSGLSHEDAFTLRSAHVPKGSVYDPDGTPGNTVTVVSSFKLPGSQPGSGVATIPA